MGIQTNGFRENILVITFVAFDNQEEKHFFDATVEQASNYIWKHICPTAVILFADEYAIEKHTAISVKKKKLSDVELEKMYKK